MLPLRPDLTYLNCLFYRISLINASFIYIFYFILTEKIYGQRKKNKIKLIECTFIFIWKFENIGIGSPENLKIKKKVWPNAIFVNLFQE